MQTNTAPIVGRDAGLGTLPDLLPFCSEDETRPSLMAPWNADPYTYATDGRIIVRVAMRPEWNQKSENHPQQPTWLVPGALKLFADFPHRENAVFVPVPELPHSPGKVECLHCKGMGAEVDDDGDMDFCDYCDGEKFVDDFSGMQVADRRVAVRYMHKLAKLPGILIGANFGDSLAPMPFIFDGGEGLLMPMKPSA